MNTEEAKFILSAFRPNGSDAGSPQFTEAMRIAGDDPMLAAWFERSRAHDAAVASKLRTIAPPAGLRDAILAGSRVSRGERRGVAKWAWFAGLAAAAAVAAAVFTMREPAGSTRGAGAFADFAINDMNSGHHGSSGEAVGTLVGTLQTKGAPMPGADAIDFDKLRSTGCRSLTFAGHEVLEVCFARDGAEFHLYIARREGALGDSIARGPAFIAETAGAAAVWADPRYDYAVVSSAGVEAIRRLL